MGCGDGFCKRVENSPRGEQFGDLNSSGFILLRCIIIETTKRKLEVWIWEPPLLVLFCGFKVSVRVQTCESSCKQTANFFPFHFFFLCGEFRFLNLYYMLILIK